MMLDRHIILYDKNDTECDSMGIAVLDEHIKDDVIRETMNSNYTFEFMIEHEYANLLEGRSIIKAPTRQGEELFRVRLVERNLGDDGYSYVYCVQLFYCDMEDRLIEDLELNDVTGSTALTKMSQATDAPHNFTFYSDIDTVAYSYYYHKQFATALIGDLDESFVNLWGGELEVNKWDVKMHKHRGENRGVKVRYRDNMTGLNAAHDYSPVITRLYPMSADGITLDEKYVDSPLMDPNHPITQSMVFDYIYLTQDDGSDGGYLTEAEVKAAIKEMAQDMFSIGNIDKPESRYDVSLEELCRTREASHYAVLDYIFIGDTVEIQHEDWGVDVSTRLIEYTYQPKTDRYLSMTLGTVTGTFSNNTQRTQESILNKIETNKQTIQGQLNAAVDHLTSLIKSGLDGHVVITENEILIMDTTDKSTAVEVWRFNSGGIGYSNTGYNGPFIGLTKNGKLVVNEATAHTLSASLIKTGLLQSADGKSWWDFDNGHFSWADGAFSFNGEQFEFKINGTNIADALDKSFTISASHESQVIPTTADGLVLEEGEYEFSFTVFRNYSGQEAVCMVTNVTPSETIKGISHSQNENTFKLIVAKDADLSQHPEGYFDIELTILDNVLTKRISWWTSPQGAQGENGADGEDGKDAISQKYNLIKNSAFFKGQSGWTLTTNASLDYENKYGDHPTVHVVGNGVTTESTWYGISSTINTTITEFKEGVTYTLSYYYYVSDVTLFDPNLTMTTPTTTAFGFNVGAIDADGNTTYLGTSTNISGLVEGLWTKYTTSFTPKKNYKVGRVKFGLAANGEVWATDFKLEENTEASDWCGTADETIGQDGVDGQPGHDAQTVSIVASSTVFKSTDGGVTFRPGSITLTPLYQNVTHSKWLYSTNNGTSWITISNNGVSGISLNGQAVAVSYDCQLFTNSITTVQFKVISANASVYDVITITKISERADLNDALATMEMTINQSNTAWQAAFKTSSANNLLKNSDAKFGTENWITNGGGIAVGKANAFPFYGYEEPYFETSFPSGIKYAEDIILEPNTDYVYEGYVYVNGSIAPGNRTPLHFYCYTTNTGTVEACNIIDYRQNLVSGRFIKCYVHFKTKNVNSNIYFRALVYSTSTVEHVGVKRLSLKKGDRETEWCQHPNEVATAAVTISENGLKSTHSEADTYTLMNARGNAIYDVETGEALAWMSAKKQWTEAKFDYIYAKNIVNCYTGDYTLYVNHSHTGPSLGTAENPFSSFADLRNHLPENTIITQDLHIIVRDPGFVIHEPLTLWRISGSGYIRIELEGTLVIENDYHAIELIQINTWVLIRSGRTDVNSATTGAVLVARASNVDGVNCIRACDVSRLEVGNLTMVNTNGCAIQTERTDLYTNCCDFGNSDCAIWLKHMSSYYTCNDCGSCKTFTLIGSGSKAYWGHAGSPIRPSGDCYAPSGVFFSFANCSTKSSARYTGTSAPSAPSGTQNHTQSFDHTALQTYQYSWRNWSTDGSCKQGSWGYGRRGGHMFFDINAIRSFLSGTVADGNTITLTRANSGGLNAQSNVYLCGSTCSSANGTPSYSNRTHIGTIGWGEKKTFSIPLAIVQSLKSGTCSSLAIHVDSDAQNDYINITSASITLKCKK